MTLFGQKLCDLCNKNRATIKFTKIDGDQVNELLICQTCAGEHSPLHARSEEQGANLSALFANLLKEKAGEESAAPAPSPEGACASCGMPFETYRKTFLLGCPACYESFASALLVDLRKVHGDTIHRGKAPHGHVEDSQAVVTLEQLRRQLSEAIGREDFEAAAHIRDQIRSLERGESE